MKRLDYTLALRGLLSEESPWPEDWGDSEWQGFADSCSLWQLDALLYFRIRERASSCPKDVLERLRNRFDLLFAHWGRLKAEVEGVSQKLDESGVKFGFFKGYPLALRYYPHPACRSMQDVDGWMDFEGLDKARKAFKALGYSSLPEQSTLERKPQFVKLHGPHVFAFEFHRSLHTGYLDTTPSLPMDAFARDGFPKPEVLFLSVLLHHKFFESSIRDLLDLHFLTCKNMDLNWDWMAKFCREEGLLGHVARMAHCAETHLGSEWPKRLNGKPGQPNRFLLKVKDRTLFRKKNRGVWEKFCDAALTFLVYDRPVIGFRVFWNKYLRHVKFSKYFKLGLGKT